MSDDVMTILYANLTPLLAMVFLLGLATYHPMHDQKQTRIFQFAAFVEIFMLLIISFDFLISRQGTNFNYYELRRFSSFCNFAFSPFIPLLLYKIYRPQANKIWFYLPFLSNVILCFYSIFAGTVFRISAENTYGRGPAFFFPFLITIYYMGILILQHEFRYKRNKQIERMFLFCCVGILSLGMFLEIAFGFSFLTWAFSALCLFAYYCLVCIHSSIIDPLTGAYNRRNYDKVLAAYEHHKHFSVAMLDINDFKLVNDRHGHEAGDRYLIDFVNLLEHHLGSYATIYRIGGDEFILLSKKLKASQLEQRVLLAKQKANDQNMDFAFGICEYSPSEDIANVLALVDQRMYENKNLNKQKR